MKNKRHENIWPSERSDTLRMLAVEGCSASVIAAQLGTTRNAIIGKCRRIGVILKWKSRPTKIEKPTKHKVRFRLNGYQKDRVAPTVLLTTEERTRCACTLADIKNKQCHWPLWDWGTHYEDKLYCGCPATYGQYCDTHYEALTQGTPAESRPSPSPQPAPA